MVSDDRLQYAYTAAVNTLARQNSTIGNLRNRTMALLTVASLATSFATGVGLLNTNPSNGAKFPSWAAWALICLVAAIGALCVYILWPIKKFRYGPGAKYFIEHSEMGESTDDMLRALSAILVKGSIENEANIDSRMKAFEVGAVLLIAEVLVLGIAIIVN